MLQTVLHIPHEIAGWPVFGWGWALALWIAFSTGMLAWLLNRHGWQGDTPSFLWMSLFVSAAILWLLPRLEERAFGHEFGLPIRGYGVMLMLGVIAGVWLASYRARQVGLDPDLLYGLAFAVFVAGIAGARLFYVIQYWPDFRRESWLETLGEVAKFTEGGLVVYGSLIGCLAATAWYAVRHKLPMLALGDLMAPCLLVGLAFGRIGCLLNGCCFGGTCELSLPRISFPPGSPPYLRQLEQGTLTGLQMRSDESRNRTAERVATGSLAERSGLRPGDRLAYAVDTNELLRAHRIDKESTRPVVTLSANQRTTRWTYADLPPRSQPVHPTQLYASVNAALLAWLLWNAYPYRRRDGQVLGWLLVLYPLTRYILEIVRTDEPGRFGTNLSISQWVSLLMISCAISLLIYLSRLPAHITSFETRD